MSDIVTAMRTAVDADLRGDPDFVAAFSPSKVRLFPLAAPANSEFPYVIYRIEAVGNDTECGEASDVTVSLDVFARLGAYEESVEAAEAIAGAARRVLVRQLEVAGHVVDDWTFLFDRPVGDPDPLTEHRSLQVAYLTSAAA